MATANKNLSEFDKDSLPEGVKDLKFGIVTAEWNGEITGKMREGAYETLVECGVKEKNIVEAVVPGSVELVYGASAMMKEMKDLSAIIVIGCVIQGETKHFDYVCQGVTQGIAILNAKGEIPVIFCVLTDENIEQSRARSGGVHGNKGVEAAVTAIKMSYYKNQF